MLDDVTGDVPAVATAPDAGETGTTDLSVSDELSEVATQELASDPGSEQEQSETQEAKPETQDDPAESKDVKAVRDWGKSLERDIKQKFAPAFTGLEKVATELFGVAEPAPEDVQAAIATVQALAPSIKVLTSETSTQAEVVSALQKLLPQEHVEAIAWATLNDPASQDFIFSDPEVLQKISERLFDGKSIDEVNAILASAPVVDGDPEKAAWRKEQSDFKAERLREASEKKSDAAQKQSDQMMTRFFETPAQRVIAEEFNLKAPEGASEADKALFSDAAKDIRFAAQGRFLEANMAEYMRIDNLYREGKLAQGQAAEIRLSGRYEATLIKTAERHANLLKSRSVAKVNEQQTKIKGVRPDVSGSVDGTNGNNKEAPYDPDDPGFMQRFVRDVNPALHN